MNNESNYELIASGFSCRGTDSVMFLDGNIKVLPSAPRTSITSYTSSLSLVTFSNYSCPYTRVIMSWNPFSHTDAKSSGGFTCDSFTIKSSITLP